MGELTGKTTAVARIHFGGCWRVAELALLDKRVEAVRVKGRNFHTNRLRTWNLRADWGLEAVKQWLNDRDRAELDQLAAAGYTEQACAVAARCYAKRFGWQYAGKVREVRGRAGA